MSKLAKITGVIGSILLLATAGFHSTALNQASEAANAENAHALVAMTFEGIWLMPSITWIIVALLSVWLVFRRSPKSAQTTIVLSLIPLAHAVVILIYTGPFIGAYMLIASSSFILLGSILALKTLDSHS